MPKSLLIRLKKSFNHRYNSLTKKIVFRVLILLHNEKNWNNSISSKKNVLWVLGMFRSGTSLTSQILKELGYDFGNENDLIKPIGVLRNLNPNGFFENFIFVEYSRYFLIKTGKKGDDPPKVNEKYDVSFEDVDFKQLVYFSLFQINDDRVTLFNKYRAFRKLSKHGINKYLEKNFTSNAAIKNPSLSFYYSQLSNHFPNSNYLIIFRNPDSVLKSSKILTSENTYELYNIYHEHFLNLKNNSNIIYFSYDNLINYPADSIECLSKALNLKIDKFKLNNAISIIDNHLLRNKPDNLYLNHEKTKSIYNELLKLSINQFNNKIN